MASVGPILVCISAMIFLIMIKLGKCTEELKKKHDKAEATQQQVLEELRQIKELLTKDE